MKTAASLLLVATLLSGCYSRYAVAPEHLKGLTYAEGGGEVVEHYHIETYGWYLFNKIPIVCGDPDDWFILPMDFFMDEVRTDLVTEDFNKRVRETGLKAVSVAMSNADTVAFDVPGLSFPLVLPYILCYREVQISGLLVKPEEGGGEK